MIIDGFNNTRRVSSTEIEETIVNLNNLVFEVTDACNLACKYCVYGGLYWGYDCRQARYMKFEDAKAVIDYLSDIWEKNYSKAEKQPISFGFYGGEPLLNIPLIKEIVSYVKSLNLAKVVTFSMTTNCLLLDKYMDFLVDNDFELLCSLDGDYDSNSFRVRHDGSSSFEKVFSNLKKIKSVYPDYFNRNIWFNTVIHKRNSVQGVCDFFSSEFDKIPIFSELSDSGVRPDKREEFNNTFKSLIESINSSSEPEQLSRYIGGRDPRESYLMSYFLKETGNTFEHYYDLFYSNEEKFTIPSATCIPFSKKIFVKVDGKILPCERIPHAFAYGEVKNGVLHLDCDEVAKAFNSYLDVVQTRCSSCYLREKCKQCLYRIDGMSLGKPNCNKFVPSANREKDSMKAIYANYLLNHPDIYLKFLNETMVE